MEEWEQTAKQFKTNAEFLESLCQDKLTHLYQDKRKARKNYQEEHQKIATQFTNVSLLGWFVFVFARVSVSFLHNTTYVLSCCDKSWCALAITQFYYSSECCDISFKEIWRNRKFITLVLPNECFVWWCWPRNTEAHETTQLKHTIIKCVSLSQRLWFKKDKSHRFETINKGETH